MSLCYKGPESDPVTGIIIIIIQKKPIISQRISFDCRIYRGIGIKPGVQDFFYINLWLGHFHCWFTMRCVLTINFSRARFIFFPLPTFKQWGTEVCACCLADSEGCVCGSSHLLNITLTMHRFLISSSDLLDKLITLYPSARHRQIQTVRWPIFQMEDGIRSVALLCAAFLWLSTATGNQARTWLTMQPVAVGVKCDGQVAARLYSCCQFCCRPFTSLIVEISCLITAKTKFIFATSHPEEKHVFSFVLSCDLSDLYCLVTII